MLINRLPEVNDRGEVNGERTGDQTQDYQTASELFNIMSQDQQLNVNNDALTASDLVLLYKNFDVGTNLMSESSMMTKKPNQHVETVVYEDDPDSEDSDIAEIFNTDDVNVYECNKERLDILSNEGLGNTLCQKLGGIEIQTSKLKNEYHQHFNVFQESLIKDQLNYSFGFEDFEGAILPATLLDYICCKRLEDNYNFYMDNIIRYVKHTIEQLKRISNGDYLTDKAKEKWREVSDPGDQTNNTKILATTTSIPLHIERKASKLVSAWDDIVHSEVDVRSLSKILEKKIIVEVPKLICGTYKLFSRQCADNLIISCKRENNPSIKEEKENSRVDVVLQLEKSESGHVVSNISSIMILKSSQEIRVSEICNPLTLPYKNVDDSFFEATENSSSQKLQIVEIKHDNEDCLKLVPKTKQEDMYEVTELDEAGNPEGCNEINEYTCIEYDISSNNHSYLDSSESNDAFRDTVDKEQSLSELSYDMRSTELLAMKRFKIPSSLPEESIDDVTQNTLSKKNSPIRIRIKSPYENKSHMLEEKKRRRLLEIREKRERKKMALGENCKISKHKYAKGGVMPQASSSVTKLSITNKSFYNSIYGQTVVIDQNKAKNRKGCNNDPIPELPLDNEGEHNTPVLTPDTKKYVNKSYYLEDTETEMMYMQTKQNESSEIKACSASTSVESSDFRANLTLLSQLIGSSGTNLNAKLKQVCSEEKTLFHEMSIVDVKEEEEPRPVATIQSIINLAPTNSPKNESIGHINDAKKASTSVECRKSIDKIYDLMKKLERGDSNDNDQTKTKLMNVHTDRLNVIGHRVSSTIQGSDSGTSLKHHLTSSNPSCFSFEKTNTEVPKLKAANKKSETPVVPKVIISNKVQIIKTDGDRNKKPKRPMMSPTLKTRDNPLKAISQLLHEFDNVQKCRQKPGDSKANKRHEVTSNDEYSNSYQGSSKRRSRLESHFKDKEVLDRTPKVTSPRKLKTSLGIIRSARVPIEENHDKINKRKITDIIDEVKEARGEAVKGPSKINSRLNSLAQPKKSYVQARIDEHTRPSKNLTDRQTKLAMAPLLSERNMDSANSRNKVKITGTEAVSLVSMKKPPVQPLDKVVTQRRSANSSPENTSKPPLPVSSSKRYNMPPTPETLKKMVAVESYVKNNYRRAPPTSLMRDRPLVAAHKSRIPLLPKDIELASITSANTAEESTEVGSKLHHMINTMFDIAPGLTVSEDLEITCNRTHNLSNNEQLSRGDERASIDSDYPVDVFEDKHIATAVENVLNRTTKDKITDDVKIFKSATEIEKLENALSRKWPTGAFQKRLRIKNLTLTPKHSMKQVFFLQSGDGSLVIKSSLSKSIHLDANNEVRDLKALPVLSKTEMDWNFTNIPMQIATVGYAFPHYQSPFEPNKIKSLVEVYKTVGPSNDTLESNEDIKVTIEQPKPLMEEIPEDEGNTEESSIPVLKVKAEEGKIDLVQGFVDAIKLNERPDMSSLKVLARDNETVQKPDSKNIDYTTSLDMLMGLLNEIQRITSCQTHITNKDADDRQCKELETILDDAATLEALSNNPRELVSIASLDKMRKLESNPSMYAIYLSSDDENDNNSSNILNVTTDVWRTLYVDKEVNVDIGTPECINRFTDVPSIFPLNINHSTNVTNSLMGVLSRPSSQSIFSFMEYQTLYSNSSVNTYKNIIQLPHHIVANENKEITSKHCSAVCEEKEKLNEKPDFDPCKLSLTKKETARKVKQNLIRCKNNLNIENFNVQGFDPMLKMKRDILVTVYSILVITVFAALSFPEVLYHV